MKHLGYRTATFAYLPSALFAHTIYDIPHSTFAFGYSTEIGQPCSDLMSSLSNYTMTRERIYGPFTINLSLIEVHIRPQSVP